MSKAIKSLHYYNPEQWAARAANVCCVCKQKVTDNRGGEVLRRVSIVALFLDDNKTNDDDDGDGKENGKK